MLQDQSKFNNNYQDKVVNQSLLEYQNKLLNDRNSKEEQKKNSLSNIIKENVQRSLQDKSRA